MILFVKLKEMLQLIWNSLPQQPIDRAVKEFSRLQMYVRLVLQLRVEPVEALNILSDCG